MAGLNVRRTAFEEITSEMWAYKRYNSSGAAIAETSGRGREVVAIDIFRAF